MIIARIDGAAERPSRAVTSIGGVTSASRCTATSSPSPPPTAPSVISPVAVALSGCDVKVRDLTLRTTTLDDVFLELTGNRIEHADDVTHEEDDQ